MAEAKDYPFEISICIDNSCLPGADALQATTAAIRDVSNKHGKGPKLARRDGKPLVAGYNSIFVALGYAEPTLGRKPPWQGKKDWRRIRRTSNTTSSTLASSRKVVMGASFWAFSCARSWGNESPNPLAPTRRNALTGRCAARRDTGPRSPW